MAKRFTDSRKWDDPWFSDLPIRYKLLWLYILDKCDHAGIYKVNLKLAGFLIDSVFTLDEALEALKGRIQVIDSETWYIPKFVTFQYGELSQSSKTHRSVMEILRKEGLLNSSYTVSESSERVSKGLDKGIDTLKDKDKDKDKDKGGVGDFDALDAFNCLLAEYPVKIGESRARQLFFQWQVTTEMVSRIHTAIKNYKKHLAVTDWKKPMNFNTFLEEWLDWEKHVEIETEEQRIARLKERLKV